MKLEPALNEQQRWEYYKRNLIFWGLFFGFIPGLYLFGGLLGRLIDVSRLLTPLAFAWALATIGAAAWRLKWKCPRCHKQFYTRLFYKHSFATKCVHCGFRPEHG